MADSGPRKPGNSKEVDWTDNDESTACLSLRGSGLALAMILPEWLPCGPRHEPSPPTSVPSYAGSQPGLR